MEQGRGASEGGSAWRAGGLGGIVGFGLGALAAAGLAGMLGGGGAAAAGGVARGGEAGPGGAEAAPQREAGAGTAAGRGTAGSAEIGKNGARWPAQGAGEGGPDGPGEAATEARRLLERLASLPRDPAFVRWAEGAPEALRGELLSLLLAAGELERARELLADPPQVGLAVRLAQALEKAQRQGEAAELWRALLAEAAGEIGDALAGGQAPTGGAFQRKGWRAWIEGLGRTDPGALLALVDGWLQQAAPEALAGLEALRARPLAALGRLQEASDLLARLAARPDQFQSAYRQLLDLDPAGAEAFLRGELAHDPADSLLRGRLAILLIEQERTDELEQLLDGLATGGDPGLPQVLGEVGFRLPLEQLERFAGLPELAVQIAPALVDRYAGEERWEDAAGAYESLVRGIEQGRVPDYLPLPPDELIEHDRAAAWRWAQRLAALEHGNDEVWGDVGDLLLHLGDEAGAQRAWERALQLDPTDGEWISKLRRLRRRGLEGSR